jgi:outer membrane biosynthesis protein TonB
MKATSYRLLLMLTATAACAGNPSLLANRPAEKMKLVSVPATATDPTAFAEAQVDKKAEVKMPLVAKPKYPANLEMERISGEVYAQFIVDTLGQVEPATFQILEYSRLEFVDAVKDVLPRMRFIPAELKSKKVRQLLKQRFQFVANGPWCVGTQCPPGRLGHL